MKHVLLAAGLCFVAGVVLYPILLTVLVRFGAGQKVQRYNPTSHRIKAGTPTMGGILFCLLTVVAWLVFDRSRAGFIVIYALVDSLVLHSGYSTVRLESFLFTREAFEDIKARMKPDGVFAAYNAA